jgi:hypothetical protein
MLSIIQGNQCAIILQDAKNQVPSLYSTTMFIAP